MNLSLWKVGVCGSSHKVDVPTGEFCMALGRSLASRNVAIVSSGLKRREEDAAGHFAAAAVENDGAWCHSATKYLRQDAFGKALRRVLELGP